MHAKGAASLQITQRDKKPVPNKLPRERLKELRMRSGYASASQLARDAGYASTTGYIHFEQKPYQGDKPIPYSVIKKLMPLLVGRGSPPITPEELLLLTNVKDISVPQQNAFVSVVSDGDGLLSVKYKIEPGIYVKMSQPRSYGASRLGTSPVYPKSAQFAVVVASQDMRSVQQLQCVERSHFPDALPKGKRVIVAVSEGNDLVEIALGAVGADGSTVYRDNGQTLKGTVVGVVVGSYVPE